LLTAAKGSRQLIDELDSLSVDRDGPKLLRNDHLEDLRGLMRGAVKCRGAEQGDSVVQAEMVHKRIDPARRVWSAGGAVFRPQDEVEAVLRTRQATLPGQTCRRSRERGRREARSLHGFGLGQIAAAPAKLLVEVAVQGFPHAPNIFIKSRYSSIYEYEWGAPPADRATRFRAAVMPDRDAVAFARHFHRLSLRPES
jgi:hypothetical protein